MYARECVPRKRKKMAIRLCAFCCFWRNGFVSVLGWVVVVKVFCKNVVIVGGCEYKKDYLCYGF